jgi:hypothetical protein
MRIRTIKPEFFTHEGLFDLERETGLPVRVAYAGLWCAADRAGRFKWEPRRLGISILPYDEVDFSRVLHALTTRGFLVRYRVKDAWFGAIPSWEKHQIVNNREKLSDIPEPSAADEVDACLTRDSRVPHASQEEGKGREGKGRGKEGVPPQVPVKHATPHASQTELLPDERHHEITSKWGDMYRGAFDQTYSFATRDAATLKRFLTSNRDASTEILETAAQAWHRSKLDRYAKRVREAATIHGLCTFYNEIRLELKTPAPLAHANGTNPHQRAAPTAEDHRRDGFEV